MNKINVIKLNSSVTLVAEENKFAESYSLGFCFPVGSRNETRRNNGISHFIEHLLFKGTEKRSAKQISLETEKIGTYLNAFTSKEMTCFYSRGLNGTFAKSFEILSDMILNPLFDKREIEKEKNVVIDELQDSLDSPEDYIYDEIEKTIYDGSSLAFPIIGSENNINNFNREIIKEYYEKNYLKGKIYISATGNISINDLIKLSEKFLIKKENGFRKKNKSVSVANNEQKFVSLIRPVNQYYSIIGKTASGINDRNYLKIKLLSIVLGEGSSSRLYIKLRENNGIAYQISSFVSGYKDISTFGIYFSTNPAQKKKAEKLIFKELEKMSEKNILKTEFQKAKNVFISNYVFANEDLSGKMFNNISNLIYYGKIKNSEEIKDELKKINYEETNEFAKILFEPNSFSQIEIINPT